ncbi:MAG: four helix bundle protein [Candidatus Blackburnbacteria bacterium]|nr:four helix bundle protein [Candidatus Blackburnbacteria bacterium]
METERSFKDLRLWQLSEEIFEMVCEDVRNWPKIPIARSISYQILDSAGSMGSNLAEGYGRGGPREFEQFARIARGPMAETDSWLYKALKQNLITDKRYS